MAAITLSVGSASERDRVLKTRRAGGILKASREAVDQEATQSNAATGGRFKSNESSDDNHEEVVAKTKLAHRQDQNTDHPTRRRKSLQSNEPRTSPQVAKQDSPTSPATGDNNRFRILSKLDGATLIGSGLKRPVSVSDNHRNYLQPLNVSGEGRLQVKEGSRSETHVNRIGLRSILKEHQTGILADKAQRRTSHSAGGNQQQQQQQHESDEKNQQRSSSVDDNQSRAGSSSGHREDTERDSSGQQQQRARKQETRGQQGKLTQESTKAKNLEPEDDEDQRGEPNWSTGSRGKRPPTFGTTPYKLSRLPYYSYYGKARNVELVNRVDRDARREDREKRQDSKIAGEAGGESSGRSSTSLSQHSLSSLSSQTGEGRKTLKAAGRANWTRTRAGGRDQSPEERTRYRESGGGSGSRRGYSNISNLFPGEPSHVRRPESRAGLQEQGEQLSINRKHSTSLSNLSTQQAKRSLLLKNKSRLPGESQFGEYPAERNSLSATGSRMRRQNSSLSGRPLGTRYNGVQTQARPTSAFGGHSLSQYHRSPSAMSLMYGGSTGGSPIYGGQGPIDPDCPVHGYSPLGAASMSKSTQQLNAAGGGFGAPEVDLLYEPQPPLASSYTDGHPRDHLYPTGPLSQPLMTSHGATLTKRQPSSVTTSTAAAAAATTGAYLHQQQLAPTPATGTYYNGPNRFSVYHSMGNDFGTRSSLAPPNEQLRRILGYQPQPRPVHLHPQWAYSRPFIHLQDSGWRSPSPSAPLDPVTGQPQIKPVFMAYNQLQDTQAVRAIDFHPSGEVYAVGSNSRVLRICAYPADYELRHYDRDRPSNAPRVLFKFLQVHRGSIYCVQFNATGQLLATGSNDQTVHIARYNSTTHCPDGDEFRLTMHDGTVRDLCFIDDSTNGSALLLSAGGGDNKIYVTDCDTITPFQSMTGHTQTVMSLHHWGGANFVSASLDKSIRFWDLRTRSCTSIVSAPPSTVPLHHQTTTNHKWAGPGAPVCAVKVDPSGRLMASGHSDSTCMLYDIRGARIIQSYKPHDDEVRTLSFSPKSYYLLSGGYDGRIILTDLQGDLTQPLPTCCVAECDDKIVQAKWHPSDFTFVTTSADKTATLWALPTE